MKEIKIISDKVDKLEMETAKSILKIAIEHNISVTDLTRLVANHLIEIADETDAISKKFL